MKTKVTKRVLALVLVLAMLVPCFLETAHTAHADTITATPAVYDLYDLSGTTSITVNGTGNGNWDPIVIGNIDAADKENVSFKANVKITEDKGYRFSLGAPENVNCQNPNGYGFELNYEGGWLAFIRGSDQQWVAGWGKDNYDLNQLKGEYELEFGYHDIIEDGNVVGKRIFLKKNGEVLFTADDKGSYMTGDAFGTKVALFHYGTAVEMKSTYETSYGSVKTYDIYDLTGTTSFTINGTGNHNWEGTVIGDIDAAHKENVSFKANVKITDGGEHRFSLGAKESSAYTDPNTYGLVLHFNMSRLVFIRNNSWIHSLEINNDDFKGEYELEFGYRDITFGGNVIGKQLFVKKNGELVYTYDDMNGYLTGDALGTKVALFHYGSVDTFNTTYSNSYGSANVYDIYDLTGASAKSVDPWNPTQIGTIAEADKEQAAVQFKFNITNARHRYRFAVGNTADGNGWDPKGYSVEIAISLDGQTHVKLLRGGSQIAKFDDVSGLIGEHVYEFGYRNITMGSNVLGKQVYLSVDGVDLYTYDDNSGYLTGDSLGTWVTMNHIDDGVAQLNSTYSSGFGTVNVYDVADLTGARVNPINGTGNHNWEGTVIGDIDAAHKENVSFKANVKITDGGEHRFSLGAKESSAYTDPNTYGLVLHFDLSRLVFIRNNSWINSLEINNDDFKGEYELEFGYRDITLGKYVLGKQLFVKKNGELVYTYDDMSGYLTGDALGTKVALFHYGTVVEMNSTKECSHNYSAETTNPDCVNAGKTVYTCTLCGDSYEEAIGALGHNYVGVVTTPATCTTDGVKTYTCSNCNDSYEEVIPAGHTIEHVPAVVPANCQETGHDEYWYCAGCDAYFGDAEASYQVNPAWINYTGEHVRPEGAAICAVVPCELCGEDSYGEPCDRGDAPVCQDAPCVNCGEIVWGWGCNYNTGDEEVPLPLCQPGDCVYCGTHYEKLYDCENGAWSPCLDGECAYGCGKQYPATAEHALEDPCAGGMCSQCWNTIEGAHDYESVVTPPTAIKEGYTTHTCSVCGDSYTDSTVPAVGIGELGFSGANLALHNDLSIKLYADANLFIEDAYTAPYVVCEFGYKTMTITDYKIVDGKYVFTCDGISPSQIGDAVNVTLHATLNGEENQVSYEYGVAQYCYNMLAKTDDSKLKTLLVDLLNYGAAAQEYASYKNSTLCNADLTEEQRSWGTQTVPAVSSVLNTKYATVENAKAKWKGASLYLENNVSIRARFAAESIENLSVKATIGDNTYVITEFEADAANPGSYIVYFDQINASQMRETVYLTVCEGDTAVSNTVTYSVESYVAAKLNDSNVKLANLVASIIKYGDAAYNLNH